MVIYLHLPGGNGLFGPDDGQLTGKMNAPGGICPPQGFDMHCRPIHIPEKGFAAREQIGIDRNGEVSPILPVGIAGQTPSRKRVGEELDG